MSRLPSRLVCDATDQLTFQLNLRAQTISNFSCLCVSTTTTIRDTDLHNHLRDSIPNRQLTNHCELHSKYMDQLRAHRWSKSLSRKSAGMLVIRIVETLVSDMIGVQSRIVSSASPSYPLQLATAAKCNPSVVTFLVNHRRESIQRCSHLYFAYLFLFSVSR